MPDFNTGTSKNGGTGGSPVLFGYIAEGNSTGQRPVPPFTDLKRERASFLPETRDMLHFQRKWVSFFLPLFLSLATLFLCATSGWSQTDPMAEDAEDMAEDAALEALEALEEMDAGLEGLEEEGEGDDADPLDLEEDEAGLEEADETQNGAPDFDPDDLEPDNVAPAEVPDLLLEAYLQRTDPLLARGAFDEVLALWREVPGEAAVKIDVYNRVIQGFMQRKNYYRALEVLLLQKSLTDGAADPNLPNDPTLESAIRNDLLIIVKTHLQEEELRSVVATYLPNFPADEALLRLVTIYDNQGDYYREEQEIERFIDTFPSHPETAAMRTLAGSLREKIKTIKHLVGVVLPMHGAMAPFGRSVLDSIRLAMGHFKAERPTIPIGWVVREMEETSPSIEKWLEEYRPLALVGPLLSKEVNRVAPALQGSDLLLVTPGATGRQIQGIGKSVIRNAMTNGAQCRALAKVAVSRKKLKSFAILYPSEPTGTHWMKCFSDEVAQQGGRVVVSESYLAGESDFSDVIKRLIKAENVPANRDGAARTFDALFLPTTADEAGLIIPQLAFHNLGQVTLLGLNSWNDPELLKRAGRHADGSLFVDGFFAGSANPTVAKFVGDYQKRFGRPPDLLAAQAYDATRWILAAVESGARTPHDVKRAVLSLRQRAGVSGFLSEIQNGEAIKEPFFIEVKKGKFSPFQP